MTNTYPDDVKARAVSLYVRGMGLSQVADIIGCEILTLRSWLEKADATIRKPGRPGFGSTKREEALAQAAAGVCKNQIAQNLALNAGTVYRWIKEAGETQAEAPAAVETRPVQESTIRPLSREELMQGRAGGYRSYL